MRAPRSSSHSSSTSAPSGSASDSIGTAMIRSWYEKPQSSSNQRLNARSVAIVAGMSSRSACSMPHASVGNISTASRPCSSITARRASRSRYSGRSGSTFMSERGSTPSGIWPRNIRSMQPATMIGSNVGFGMKRKILPPASSERVTALLHRLHPALAELLVEVAGARVDRLVVVVVGVDGAECDVHGLSPFVVPGLRLGQML